MFEYDYDKNKKEYYSRIQNPAGKIKEVWYNDKGETKRVDNNGRTIQKISQESRTNAIIDEAKNTTNKEYDERDNLKKVTYSDASTVLYEYDLRFNKVKTMQDQLGRITQYEYDANGNLITKTQAPNTENEQVTSYTHDAMGRVLTVTTHADTLTSEAVTTFVYDENGNLASITDPEENTTLFTSYDIMGNLLEKIDARDKTWVYEYDAKGRLKSATNPLTHKTSYEYDGIDNRTAMITPDLKRFEYEYDEKGNLVKTTDPLSNITRLEYSLDGKLLKQIDPENKETAYEYDTDRRLLNTIDGSGNTTTMEYSQGGCSSCSGTTSKPARVIFPTFEKSFTYDSLGRKLSETDVLSELLAHTTQFEYDNAGNLLKKTDRMGKQTHYVYDDLNRLKMVVDPADEYTSYVYDSRGNLIELTDADQNKTQFEYDANNRLKKEIRPMGEETLYEYDATGNLIRKIDAKNQKTEYEYDDANRLAFIRYYTTAIDTTPVKTVSFAYDTKGNLLSYSDGSTTASYTYDDLNRKLTETTNFGPFEKTLAYTWHKNSLKKSFTPPDGSAISYAYNENNQLAGIEIPGLGAISHGAYKWTRPQTTQLPGGSTTTRTYDALMRTTAITTKDPGANPVMTYSYAFDPMDNITQKASEHGEYNYTYDDLYRLTDSDNPDVPELTDETFTYDPVGNRLTASDTPGTWAYNTNNELETHGNTSYVYDANGNMTQKTIDGVVTRFFYNIEDRLERVEDGSNNMIAFYTYDPFGRRLSKLVSGITTYYLYSDEGLVAEYTQTGTEIKAYGWKPGSTWGTDPLFMKQGGEYYFYHNDHLGTPQKLTAVNGAVVWSAKYSSFGKAYVDPASTVENNLRFAGQYEDGETGLHYNFHRFYDPGVGRYLRPDEKGLSANVNVYNYANNNTPLYVDPNGESTIVLIGVGLVVTGVVYIAIVDHLRRHPPSFHWEPRWPDPPIPPRSKPKPEDIKPDPTVDDILNKDPLENTTCETRDVRYEKPPEKEPGRHEKCMERAQKRFPDNRLKRWSNYAACMAVGISEIFHIPGK